MRDLVSLNNPYPYCQPVTVFSPGSFAHVCWCENLSLLLSQYSNQLSRDNLSAFHAKYTDTRCPMYLRCDHTWSFENKHCHQDSPHCEHSLFSISWLENILPILNLCTSPFIGKLQSYIHTLKLHSLVGLFSRNVLVPISPLEWGKTEISIF